MRRRAPLTPEQKREVALAYLAKPTRINGLSRRYNVSETVIRNWAQVFMDTGLEGFQGLHAKERILERENLRLRLMVDEIVGILCRDLDDLPLKQPKRPHASASTAGPATGEEGMNA